MKVPYPSGIRETASRFGCDLPTHADLSRFGGSAANLPNAVSGAFTRAPTTQTPIGAMATPSILRTTSSLMQKPPAAQTVALAFPKGVDPKTALAVADKLLGDPTITNSKTVVANTIAIAKLAPGGNVSPEVHEAVSRGAAVIEAAQQIREQTGAMPGQAAIPVIGPGEQGAADAAAASSAYQLTDGDIAALVETSPEHQSLWKRFFNWLSSWGD